MFLNLSQRRYWTLDQSATVRSDSISFVCFCKDCMVLRNSTDRSDDLMGKDSMALARNNRELMVGLDNYISISIDNWSVSKEGYRQHTEV